MKYRVTAPRRLEGTMCLPASKSISNRALILQALAGGESTQLYNLSACDDTAVMVYAMEHPQDLTIDIKAAGTAMRFLTAYYAVTPGTRLLTGTERMRRRPIGLLVDALRSLGADIEYRGDEGFPPLLIRGRRLAGKSLSLPGGVSSQYVSALLMVAPLLPEGLELRLEGTVVSRPYIDLTLAMMRSFGARAGWAGGESCVLRVEPTGYRPVEYTVEGDWSAASYAYEMLALAPEGGSLFLPHLYRDSLQGDSCVASLFAPLGVGTAYEAGGVRLVRTAPQLKEGETYEADLLRCYGEEKGVKAQNDQGVYELRERLYELESKLDRHTFVRISHSEIVNLRRVTALDLTLTGTIRMTLEEGTVCWVSRRYVKKIKEALGL